MNWQLAEKWRSVEFVRDPARTNTAVESLAQLNAAQLSNLGFINRDAGKVVIVQSGTDILEVVLGTRKDDLIGSLYRPNPIFNSPADLLKARLELIEIIEDVKDSAPGGLQGQCKARGRHVDLSEMPTIQLIDVVAAMLEKRH